MHFICLSKYEKFQLDDKKALYEKSGNIIHYCFQVKELKLFHQVIGFCINSNENVLTIGYDTIHQYIMDCGISSPQLILSILENITYQLCKKP